MADCKAIVTVDAGNVRAMPRGGTSIVGIARRGEELLTHSISDVDGDNFKWIEVTIPENNLRGYIREDLVQLSGDCAHLGVASTSPGGQLIDDPNPPPPLPIDEITVLAGDCQGEVRVFLARVRSEPNASGETLGMLQRRTRFTLTHISDEDEDGFKWFGFSFNGQTGWTREDLLTLTGDCMDPASHGGPGGIIVDPQPDPEPDPISEPDPPLGTCIATIQLARVNIRSQTNTASGLLGTALQGESFAVKDVTGVQADGFPWVEIDFNGRSGFLRFDLASLTGACAQYINDDRFPSPVAASITQGYHTQHEAVDFPIPIGTQLVLPIPGVVYRSHACLNCGGNPTFIYTEDPVERGRIFSDANWGYGYGEHIIVRHNMSDLPLSMRQQFALENALESDYVWILYAHLSRRDCEVNQQLNRGDSLGLTGHTGYSTNPHLHVEVAFGKTWNTAKKVHPAVFFNIQHKLG